MSALEARSSRLKISAYEWRIQSQFGPRGALTSGDWFFFERITFKRSDLRSHGKSARLQKRNSIHISDFSFDPSEKHTTRSGSLKIKCGITYPVIKDVLNFLFLLPEPVPVLEPQFAEKTFMKTLPPGFVLAFVGALTLSGAVSASTVTLTSTLDVTQPYDVVTPFHSGWQDTPAFDSEFGDGSGVMMNVGDTLDYTIKFLGTETLSVTNLSSVWAFAYIAERADVNLTGRFSFLDHDGNAILTSNSVTSTQGGSVGQHFTAGDFSSVPSTLTFAGVHYVGTLNSIEAASPPLTSLTLVVPAFYYGTSVPEPSSLVLLGFGGLALIFRRVSRARSASR